MLLSLKSLLCAAKELISGLWCFFPINRKITAWSGL
jgi:hypothetical protein